MNRKRCTMTIATLAGQLLLSACGGTSPTVNNSTNEGSSTDTNSSSSSSAPSTGGDGSSSSSSGSSLAASSSSGSSNSGSTGGGPSSGSFGDSGTEDASSSADSSTGGGAALVSVATTACALTAAGGVECWTDGSTAAPLAGNVLTTGVTAVSMGGYAGGSAFACALNSAGGVECWGDNTWGQIGNGDTTATSAPSLVPGLEGGVTAISAGSGEPTVCAVTSAGAVECWGYNAGALGNGTTASESTVPVPITGFTGAVTAVSVGGSGGSNGFGCAIVMGGSVECWGNNAFGQLGNGTTTSSPVPVQVTGLTSGVTEIAAGYESTCALTAGGGVVCWGANTEGELGNGTTTTSSVPVAVTGLTSGVTSISTGANTVCAVTSAGAVDCWGQNNVGQVGDNTTAMSVTPVQVMTLSSGVTDVSVGYGFACAVQSGSVWCWGNASKVPVFVTFAM